VRTRKRCSSNLISDGALPEAQSGLMLGCGPASLTRPSAKPKTNAAAAWGVLPRSVTAEREHARCNGVLGSPDSEPEQETD